MADSKTRIHWVDAARGLATIFVLYGHLVTNWTEYFVFTSPIKIPLFFAISGYVFKMRDKDFGKFVQNTLIKIGIPWIMLTLFPLRILYKLIRLDFSGALSYAFNFIAGKSYWYMPCCIVALIIFFLLQKYSKTHIQFIIGVLAVTAFGFLVNSIPIFDFMLFRVACVAQFYLFLGYQFKILESKKFELNPIQLAAGWALYIGLGILFLFLYPGQCIDVHLGRYYNLFISMAMIIIGIVATFSLLKKVYIKEGILSFVGQNSLVFYIVGSQFKAVIRKVLSMLSITMPQNVITWTILFIVISLGCSVVSLILNKYFPLAVGKKKITV